MANSNYRRLRTEMDSQGISVVAMLDLYGALALLFDDMDEFQAVAAGLDGSRARRKPEEVTASKLVEAFRSSVMYFLEGLLPLWDIEDDDESDFVYPKTAKHLEAVRTEARAQVLRLAQFAEREIGAQLNEIHAEDLWAAMSMAELAPDTEEPDPDTEVEELTDEIARKLRGDDP